MPPGSDPRHAGRVDRSWADRTGATRTAIDDRLTALVGTAADELRAVDADLDPVANELQRWVAGGGKRLRPLLVVVGHEAAGGIRDDVLGAAVAVELVHTWALLHDDLIDASATRRGSPTTHRRFTAHHAGNEWSGDADDWGAAVAILLGDLVAVLADDAFASMDPTTVDIGPGQAAFSRLRREVMAGQVLDITVAASRDADIDRALQVATLKSGRYSVTRPLELGAVLGGAHADLVAELADVGDALGVAFQLRDDLLGMFGDADVTGKPVGDDLREGKRTVLVAEAMARLDSASAATLDAMLGVRHLDDDTVAEGLALLVSSGAREATSERMSALVAEARSRIDELPAGTARDDLAALADLVGTRQS
ncbi:MAG TPA: polyprenyl synthetase family protein [Nitriliruptoraceae bacterium]|nr:polyprenyl synthetase family protein [Nitriliruptoraceae bacterium]